MAERADQPCVVEGRSIITQSILKIIHHTDFGIDLAQGADKTAVRVTAGENLISENFAMSAEDYAAAIVSQTMKKAEFSELYGGVALPVTVLEGGPLNGHCFTLPKSEWSFSTLGTGTDIIVYRRVIVPLEETREELIVRKLRGDPPVMCKRYKHVPYKTYQIEHDSLWRVKFEIEDRDFTVVVSDENRRLHSGDPERVVTLCALIDYLGAEQLRGELRPDINIKFTERSDPKSFATQRGNVPHFQTLDEFEK